MKRTRLTKQGFKQKISSELIEIDLLNRYATKGFNSHPKSDHLWNFSKDSDLTSNRFTVELAAHLLIGLLISLMVVWTPVLANPEGGQVIAGSATIKNTAPNRLDIVQSSDKAIIDWRGFSIQSGEQTHFQQPGTSSIALNRVTGNQSSAIFGSLTANGRVMLVNPNGVLFGKNSQVNVGSLIATTSNIGNDDFMAGKFIFDRDSNDLDAAVINRGQIEVTEGGAVVLAAASVANEGLIKARLGQVVLAGTNNYTVDFNGDGLLQFNLGEQSNPQDDTSSNQSKNTPVSNSGTIIADGGVVQMTTRVANSIVDKVINMEGVIQARAVDVQGGSIVLSGGETGIVKVSGELDVSGTESGQVGGVVKVLGEKVGLFDGAEIDVSGDAGGGTVLVGGNFQGKGPEANAKRTFVAKKAVIEASAISEGDGGKVIAWSDKVTGYSGSIIAKAGENGGNGGFVEVSGKQSLKFKGTVDVSSEKGNDGSVLLDPESISIVAEGGANNSEINDGEWLFGDGPTSGVSTVDTATVEALLGDIIFQATENIVVDAALNLQNQTEDERVVFQAGNDININADIQSSGADLFIEADSPFASSDGSNRKGKVTIGDIVISGFKASHFVGADFNINESAKVISIISNSIGPTGNTPLVVGSGILNAAELNVFTSERQLEDVRVGSSISAGSDGRQESVFFGTPGNPASISSILVNAPVELTDTGVTFFAKSLKFDASVKSTEFIRALFYNDIPLSQSVTLTAPVIQLDRFSGTIGVGDSTSADVNFTSDILNRLKGEKLTLNGTAGVTVNGLTKSHLANEVEELEILGYIPTAEPGIRAPINFITTPTVLPGIDLEIATTGITTINTSISAKNIDITTDDLILNAKVSGTGNLKIQHAAASDRRLLFGKKAHILIGNQDSVLDGLFLSKDELQNIGDGFNSIIFNSSFQNLPGSSILVGDADFNDSVEFNMEETGSIVLNGRLSSDGAVNFNGKSVDGVATEIRLAGSIGTTSGSITINQNAVLDGDLVFDTTLSSSGALVDIQGALDGAHALSIFAGVGDVSLNGAVGDTTPLSNLVATGANISLAGVTTTGSQFYLGALTQTGPVIATSLRLSGSGPVTLDNPLNDIEFLSASITGADQDLVYQDVDQFAVIDLFDEITPFGISMSNGHVTLNAPDQIRISSGITTNGGDISLNTELENPGSIRFLANFAENDINTLINTKGGDFTAIGVGKIENIGIFIDDTSINAGGGDITLFGSNDSSEGGIVIQDSIVETEGIGILKLDGDGGPFGDIGVLVRDPGTTLRSENGNIEVIGNGGSASGGRNNDGVSFFNGAIVETTGTGDILITGTGGDGIDSQGIALGTGPENDLRSIIRSVDGNIALDGTGIGTGGEPINFGNHGVFIFDNASIETSGNGSITVQGEGGSNGAGVFASNVFQSENPIRISTSTETAKITIRADTLNLNTPTQVSGSGILELEPLDPSLDIIVGLSDSIQDGFSEIFIGHENGTGTVTVDTEGMTFNDKTTLRSPNTGGEIVVDGAIQTNGNDLTLNAGSALSFSAEINAGILNGGNVEINSGGTIESSGSGVIQGRDINIIANGPIALNGRNSARQSILAHSITINTPDALTISGALNARDDGSENAGNVSIGNTLIPSSITLARISTRNLGVGNGGNINISTTGQFTATDFFSRETGDPGSTPNPLLNPDSASIATEATADGGIIDIVANGGISTVAGIFTNSATSGNAGNLTLTSTSGSVSTGILNSSSVSGNGGNLTIIAANDLALNSINTSSGGTGNGGDISVLTTNGSLVVNQNILAGNGDIDLFANGSTSETVADLTINADITTDGGDIDLNTGLDNPGSIRLTGRQSEGGPITTQINTNGGGFTAVGFGNIASELSDGISISNTHINAGGGNISLTGEGAGEQGIIIEKGSIIESSGVGILKLTGTGGSGVSENTNGVLAIGSGTTIRSENGIIEIIGDGGIATGNQNNDDASIFKDGVSIFNGAIVESTGTGDVFITGVGGVGTNNHGIAIGTGQNNNSNSAVRSVDGDINLFGKAIGTDDLNGFEDFANHGVFFLNNASIITSGNGSITIQGESGTNGAGIFSSNEIGPLNPVRISTISNTAKLTLRADTVFLNTPTEVSGLGILELEPLDESQDISVGLSNSIQDGFSDIFIGHENGTGTVTVDSAGISFADNTTLRSPGTGGGIIVNGEIQTFGDDGINLALIAGTNVDVNANITTNGGNLDITSGGDVESGGIIDTGASDGDAGTVNIKATGNISVADIVAKSPTGSSSEINLTSIGGNIDTTAGKLATFAELVSEAGSDASSIHLEAFGDITTGDISASALEGNGGDITLISQNGVINSGELNTISVSRNGGAISLEAKGTIITGDLFASALNQADDSGSGNTGNAGNITLLSENGDINTGGLLAPASASVGSAGDGGTISVTAENGEISVNGLVWSFSEAENDTGSGGQINFTARNDIEIVSETPTLSGIIQSASRSESGTASNGGLIKLQSNEGRIIIEDTIASFTSGSSSSGNGGAVEISAASDLIINGINTNSAGAGKGGNVSVIATNGSLTVNQDILTGNGDITLSANETTAETIADLTIAADLTANSVVLGASDRLIQTVGNIQTAALGIDANNASLRSNSLNTLAVNLTGFGENFSYSNLKDLRVGSVDSISGITLNNGDLDLAASGNLIIEQAISGIKNASLSANKTDPATVSDLTLAANVFADVIANSRVLVSAADSITQTGGAILSEALGVEATAAVFLDSNSVDTLAVNLSGLSENFSYSNLKNLVIGKVGSIFGITLNNGDVDLAVANGNLSIKQALSGIMNASFSALSISANDISSTGIQNYSGDLQLAGDFFTSGGGFNVLGNSTLADDTNISTSGGNVEINGQLVGDHSLTISAGGSGNVVFTNDIGTLDSLSITANSIFLHDVSTEGAQTYTGSVTFNSEYTTTGGGFTVNGPSLLLSDTFVNTNGGQIAFNGEVNGSNSLTLSAGNSGNILFNDDVSVFPKIDIQSANNLIVLGRLQTEQMNVAYRGNFTTGSTGFLEVSELSLGSEAQSANISGTVNGATGKNAALNVQGPVGNKAFTINKCTIGISCEIPPEVDPQIPREIFPDENSSEASGTNSASESSSLEPPTVVSISVEQRSPPSDDPTQYQFSNLGNEELWDNNPGGYSVSSFAAFTVSSPPKEQEKKKEDISED